MPSRMVIKSCAICDVLLTAVICPAAVTELVEESGLCQDHFDQFVAEVDEPMTVKVSVCSVCRVEYAEQVVEWSGGTRVYSHGYCEKHLEQLQAAIRDICGEEVPA